MKYMGSKRAMLGNGLGEVLDREVATAKRFVDLFSGSGAVAIYVARTCGVAVRAIDLQHYSALLVDAVIKRDAPFRWGSSWHAWLRRAKAERAKRRVPDATKITHKIIKELRAWSEKTELPITKAYGGHYFSPKQAILLDAFRATLPKHDPARSIALAALIHAASQCAAAPGHTAQPFQPTRRAKKFLLEAWSRDVIKKTKDAFRSISTIHAQRRGSVRVADANKAAKALRKGDLAFVDPPYSGVHYSRFYHVLETIALGECSEVSGIGRYPAFKERPWSRYSVATEARKALSELFEIVSSKKTRTIVTFPVHKCSNGLSGRIVRNLAKKYFNIGEQSVKSRFSSLGGIGENGNGAASRSARMGARELILVLNPK
jgi:adenine-specific DNA methylase